jgi:hypothetical protein
MAAAVETSLNYSFPGGDYGTPGTAGVYLKKRDQVPVIVNDARGNESSFSLDQNGFEFHTFQAGIDFPENKDEFKATVYPGVISFMKEK